MAETSVNPEKETRPDWLIANIQGALPSTLGEMHKEGVATSMFDIASPESYWASDKVRGAFKDETGKERKDLFDQFYKTQLDKYNSYRSGEHAILNFNDSPNITAKRVGAKTPDAVIYKSKPDVMGRSYSSLTGYSGPEQSMREAAIKRGGKMQDGSYVKADEYKGLLKFAREDNGDWKYDGEGHPYLEPFDREKNIRSFDEIYNPKAKDWGYYGHDWDWTMLSSSLIKNPINFLVGALDSLAEYPKSLLAITPNNLGGGQEGDAYKGIVSSENWAKQFKIGNTDEGSEFFSWENLTDLGQQVFYQLASMKGVAKGVGSISNSPVAGSVASKMYMVGLSAGPMAEVSREAGLSQREQAMMLGITTGLFYPLMSLSEAAISNLASKNSQAAIRDMIKPLGVAIKSGDKSKIAAQSLNIRSAIQNMAYNIEKTVPKNGLGAAISGAGLEAIEETSEQIVDVGLRALYNGYSYVGQGSDVAQMMGTQPNSKFQINPIRELQLMGQSAIGGAIGGSLASRMFNKWNNENNEVARGMHDMVLDGKEQVLYDYINKMHNDGRLDHTWSTSKDELVTPGKISKNDEAFNILKGVTDYLVELRDNAGINELYKNNDSKAGAFKELLKTSSVGKDVARLHKEILSLQDRLDKEKLNKTPNPEQIGQTEAELQQKTEAMNKIKNGEFVTDYVMEGLYNLGAISGSKPDLNINTLSGKGFTTLTNAINAIKNDETQQVDKFNQALGTDDATATLDNFQNISEAGKTRLISEALTGLHKASSVLDTTMDEVQSIAQNMGFEISKDALLSGDPAIRTDEINALKNSILPAIQNQEVKDKLLTFLSAADKLNKIETYNPIAPKNAPEPVDLLTRMTQTIGDSVIPSSVPIATRIQEEMDFRKKQNEDAGVSVYSNTPQLQNILDSINKRLSQIEGIKLMGPSVNNFLMTRGKEKLPDFKPDQLATAQNHLRNQQAVTMALIFESEENSNNAENRIREITVNRLKDNARLLDYISELSTKTEFPLFETISSFREGILKAIDSSDFITANRLFMQMEDRLNEKFASKKHEIIKGLFTGEPMDVFKLEDPSNSYIIEAYNYLRGILSLPASDFWNAYAAAYNESEEKSSPSLEQDMVIKRVVQSLSADNYNPTLIAPHPNRINHHSSVFVQGRGGSGKTDYIIPVVAATYQQLYGGKVILSAFKDSRDTKRIKLVESVKKYFPKLNMGSMNRTLLEIINDVNLPSDVNLIVFDEATLLKTNELAQVNARLTQINNARKDGGLPTLKLMLTGDTLQNNADVDLQYPETKPYGIDHAQRHVIDRVPPIKFSFRQGNQQLILLANYFEKIQSETGHSDGFQSEYKGRKGARIIGDEKEFIKTVSSMFEDLKKKNEIHNAVYITDKSTFDIDPKIVSTGVPIITSVEAQGEQWDYVVFDPKNKSLFSDHKNIASKKDAYTAATRAKVHFIASYPENSGLSSREGAVNDIKPLNVERFNKTTKLDDITNILGESAHPIKKREARKDVHVVPSFDLFKKATASPVAAKPSTSPGTPAGAAPASRGYNNDIPDDVNQWLGEQETRDPAAEYMKLADQDPGVSPVKQQKDNGDKVAKFIRENVKGEFVALHTFFTDNTAKVLPEVLDAKRKALYDRKTIESAPYFLTIAKIGTVEYANVIRNNPQYNGNNALFLEAEVEGTRVILGSFQTADFDNFINESGIMGQNSKISVPISSSILAEAQGWLPWAKTGQEQKLSEIKKKSTGVQFGSPRIHTIKSPDNNSLNKPKFRAGDLFIPVSFKYNPDQIDKILRGRGHDEHISRIELRSVELPFKSIAAVVEKYVFKDEKGRWKYNFSDEGGRMYDAFWGNLANSKNSPEGKSGESILSKAFKDLYARQPAGSYKTFLSKYAGQYDPDVLDAAQGLKEVIKPVQTSGGKSISKGQANYFLSNYLIAKNAGSQDLQLFEKAITELSVMPAFKSGFDFDPRIEFNSTESTVFEHAKAQNLPSSVYDNMLKASVDFVSMPSLQLPKENLVSTLKKAFAEENVPSVSNSATGIVANESPSNVDNDTKKPEAFDELEDLSILGFYKRWFAKPGYIGFLPDTIATFRRMVFDSIFSLNNEGTGPRLREINDVIKEFRQEYLDFRKKYPGDFLSSLDPVNDEKSRELYKTGVIYNEMPFLLRKYFPAIVKSKTLNEETGKLEDKYVYRSSHKKQTHFNEKESFNLLADGMTEMVKSQLYNTPIIQRTKNGFKKTGDFLNPSHIESLIKMVKGASTTEEIAEKLLDSGSDIGMSVFNRFYNPVAFKLNGENTRSIGAIAHPEVRKMVDSVSLFMLSGQIFDLASVDTDEMKFAIPNQTFGVPNIMKEVMHQAINSVAQEQGEQIYTFEDGSYVINQVKVNPSNIKEPNEDDVIKAVNAMGLSNFTPAVLHEMYQYDAGKLAIVPNQDEAKMQMQVRAQLMDTVVIPTISEMKGGEVRFTSRIGVIYDAISRNAGIKGTLSQRNIDGEVVYRLRYTAPLFRLNDRIAEIRDEANSVVSDNLLVKGDYEIADTYLWEGVKNREKPKSHRSMSADETIDLDILWGFAYTLNEDHRKGQKYNIASFPGMVYSDSSSDVKFVVKAKNGYFRTPDAISKDLYAANSAYTQKVASKVVNWWNGFFELSGSGRRVESLPELAKLLETHPVEATAVAATPGVIRNLFFIEKNGLAIIKPSFLRDYNMFTSPDGLNHYQDKLKQNYDKLAERAKNLKDSSGNTLWERMNKVIEDKSPDSLLKSFYYNWVAFSQQLHLLTNGPEYQYDDKGKDSESQEYIDLVKRAKLQISNRSHQLFRNKSWLAKWKEAKAQGLEGTQLEALRYEGKKLPRVGRIAYVKDPVKALVNLVGETKMQEVYDGATFVSPLTRLMQYHSNAGEHGINASPVMKNVTTSYNNELGTNTNIKNAEFLITPEILRQGSPLAGRLVQRMLSVPFQIPVNGKNNAYELIQSLGVSPDLRNAEWTHFEQLLDALVDNGQQDRVILEVAPITSVKTGLGAVNEFDPGEGQPYISEPIDLISKGTQLDASHEIEDIPNIKTPTQHINALAINWIDPVAIQKVLGGLSKLASITNEEFEGKNDFELIERMKAFVTKAVGTKENISYLSEITDPSNRNQYSLDDRQVINTFIRNFNAYLSDNAIIPKFEGGHFILHPSSGLIPVYDVNGRTGLRSTFTPEELGNNPGRDLKWASPVREDGVSLHQLIQEIYTRNTGTQDMAQAIQALKTNPDLKTQVTAEIAALHKTLNSGWKPGFAEVLLPGEMFKDFGIKDLDIQPDEISALYFLQLLKEKHPRMAPELLGKKATAMFESFHKRLADVVARIPGTGKHSSVITKVVGFMNESQNAIFVPAELIFVQGADQDIDKGAAMTYEMVEGIAPDVDAEYKLIKPELFSDKNGKKALIAGIKNDIVDNFIKITSDPRSAVESNISVDSAMEEWKQIATQMEQNTAYSRYDFTSYAEMKEINQSGKNMVGIFANAMKAYQVLYTAFKTAGIQDSTLAGLNESFNQTWIKLAALINLSTDNAKLQVLGRLGIGEHNGNMVAYLIMKGASPMDIATFLQTYKPQMEQLKFSRRYDSEDYFSPAQSWGNIPELASTYYLGEEIGTFARSIMNRGVPSGPDEMYSYIYNMNRAINRTYKRVGMSRDFDLIRFLSNEAIRKEQINKYAKIRAMADASGIRYSEFNILQGIASTPHIMSYLNTFKLSHETVNKVSKAYKITNAVIENLDEINIKPDYYRDVQDFVYGLFVHDYMKSNNINIDGYNLGSLQGRADFVTEMASKQFIDIMKLKYPGNSFIDSLAIEDHKRYGFQTRKRLRTYDLMQMLEEKLLRLRVDFESLKPTDRDKIVNYHLIVDKGRISKGSFGQLMSPADTKSFNQFLTTIDPAKYDYKRLGELYYSYKRPGENSNVIHNSIPYTDNESSKISGLAANTPVQMSKEGVPLPERIKEILRRIDSQVEGNLDENVGLLQSLVRNPKLSDAESTTIQRVLNNYSKFVNDKSDKDTLQKIIDCT
jgi:hypothetical protein